MFYQESDGTLDSQSITKMSAKEIEAEIIRRGTPLNEEESSFYSSQTHNVHNIQTNDSAVSTSILVLPASPSLLVLPASPSLLTPQLTPSLLVLPAAPSLLVLSAAPSLPTPQLTPSLLVLAAAPSILTPQLAPSLISSPAAPSILTSPAAPSLLAPSHVAPIPRVWIPSRQQLELLDSGPVKERAQSLFNMLRPQIRGIMDPLAETVLHSVTTSNKPITYLLV